MASHAYPPHPPTGGKGLPPNPAHFAQLPPHASHSHSHVQGHMPDLEHRFKLKVRYLRVQKKYFRSLDVRKDLELELGEKEAKQQKLQDEVDLILDQIHQSDYAHLVPQDDNLFSSDDEDNQLGDRRQDKHHDDDEEEEDEEDEMKRIAPEDEERERRKELERRFGIDSNRVTLKPGRPRATPVDSTTTTTRTTTVAPPTLASPEVRLPPPAAAGRTLVEKNKTTMTDPQQLGPPNPKRIKLTFGPGGAANINVHS